MLLLSYTLSHLKNLNYHKRFWEESTCFEKKTTLIAVDLPHSKSWELMTLRDLTRNLHMQVTHKDSHTVCIFIDLNIIISKILLRRFLLMVSVLGASELKKKPGRASEGSFRKHSMNMRRKKFLSCSVHRKKERVIYIIEKEWQKLSNLWFHIRTYKQRNQPSQMVGTKQWRFAIIFTNNDVLWCA